MAEGFEYVYESVKADLHLASISGGTDICGCFVAGDPTRPVYRGEIQGPVLGMAVDVYDERASHCATHPERTVSSSALHRSRRCRSASGTTPRERYHAAYFDRFPGIWAHGDFASWTHTADS